MKIALISCGRSDYSIYLPLMRKLQTDSFFDLNIIAFGTHVSHFYDRTVDLFYKDGFEVSYELESLVLGDSPEAISTAMGLTTVKFSSIWSRENYDMIIVLGDRYEMFSAIVASIPFNIPVTHLYGGDTTLGAFDDIFRHSITLMSKLHLVSLPSCADRVKQITGTSEGIHVVGVINLDSLDQIKILSKQEFKQIWNIDLSIPTVLVTYHPETIALKNNIESIKELCKAMDQINKQFVITMPNNDTMGTEIRTEILNFIGSNTEKYKIVEVLGTSGYYSCIKHCDFLLGNTSSGITEAASFHKYVINLGNRQKGRMAGENVFHVPLKEDKILKAVKKIVDLPPFTKPNIYHKENSTGSIISALKTFHNNNNNNK
jgi:GDP/UDP-N,N'-diacetylbacillosamine 2-epimerase (hydrolysing)